MNTLCLLSLLAASNVVVPPPETVKQVDLKRYVGTWYEIARFEQRFQKGCVASSATYTARDDGKIDVVNRCRKETLDGEEKVAKGVAKVVDKDTNSKLKVSFFGPFWGDYWIVGLDADYQWVLVSDSKREALWILSRTPGMDPALYERLVGKLRDDGYAVERLMRQQPWPAS